MKETFITPENLGHAVVSPTLNRWGDEKNDGVLTDMIGSVQQRLSADGLANDSFMLIGDASKGPAINDLRARNLSHASNVQHPTPVMVLTPEGQARVEEIIHARTGISRRTLQAMLTETGYASQRNKLDVVLAALGRIQGSIKTLSLDDDTILPNTYGIHKESHMPHGFSRRVNSQLLLPDDMLTSDAFEWRQNSIIAFFNYLGKTVGEIRETHPGLRATEHERDTMNEALDQAAASRLAQFDVSHDRTPDMHGSDAATILAATSDKFGNPDFRTIKITLANLQREFPNTEVPVQSVISGERQPFAFQLSKTNVDSATLARQFDERTALTPWWFVSSDAISRANPLQTVTGHYRADNELLPVLMGIISKAKDELCLYMGGIEAQVFHNRARSGYRPNLHEQATASLVGNVAALQSAERLGINPTDGRAQMDVVEDSYEVPRDFAQRVYDQIKSIADMCDMKLAELKERSGDVTHIQRLMDRYKEVYNSVRTKLADFDFEVFYQHLNTEIRDQMRFFSDVLNAHPAVVDEVEKLIREGKYPVQQFIPSPTYRRNGHASPDLQFPRVIKSESPVKPSNGHTSNGTSNGSHRRERFVPVMQADAAE